ncbi:hypothetical protein [Rudaeicoccus suwonensis]|uniref:Uncharacterized protein n=1 Tax=Rudaeicoccus suwonensis TaxID=657409 RepID=A0A561E313_9MICO|nr:hypothetical protein [Rudaeicoccus suwonensis]TWE09990.1 hypothetical protein BKA23_2336 [Rudaeicoccus suwonensis]
MSVKQIRPIVAASVALVAAVALSACNDNSAPQVAPAPSSKTASTATPSTSTSTDPGARESASPVTPKTSASVATGSTDTKVTPSGTVLKFGQPAVIKDDDEGTFRIVVKSLTKAPASAYSAANVNQSSGTMYYINFDVTDLGGSQYFTPSSPNFLFLYPTFTSSQKAKSGGAPLNSLPGGCTPNDNTMTTGQTASNCYYYQITGATPTTVTYNDYSINLTWQS